MNLALDIGNSLIKAGLFENHTLHKKGVFRALTELGHFLAGTLIENLIISSVSHSPENEWMSTAVTGKTIVLRPDLPLPIVNRYETPATLGVDRLAAACGAWSLFPKADCLVIDAGTCINYEFINRSGEYKGGAISPGVIMRFEAMHRNTAKLPMASPAEDVPLTGNNSIQCLQSGVMNGTLEEIKGTIHRYKIDYPDIRVILCGGDAHFFENHLKPSIFVAPDLVLMGLNSILLHNVKS